eukprot:UN32861
MDDRYIMNGWEQIKNHKTKNLNWKKPGKNDVVWIRQSIRKASDINGIYQKSDGTTVKVLNGTVLYQDGKMERLSIKLGGTPLTNMYKLGDMHMYCVQDATNEKSLESLEWTCDAGTTHSWRKIGFRVGDKLYCKSPTNKWRLVEIKKIKDLIKIHYAGFSNQFDEWIAVSDPRLRLTMPAEGEHETTVGVITKTAEEIVENIKSTQNIKMDRQREMEFQKQEKQRLMQIELQKKQESERLMQIELQKKQEIERLRQIELQKKQENERLMQIELQKKQENERRILEQQRLDNERRMQEQQRLEKERQLQEQQRLEEQQRMENERRIIEQQRREVKERELQQKQMEEKMKREQLIREENERKMKLENERKLQEQRQEQIRKDDR